MQNRYSFQSAVQTFCNYLKWMSRKDTFAIFAILMSQFSKAQSIKTEFDKFVSLKLQLLNEQFSYSPSGKGVLV